MGREMIDHMVTFKNIVRPNETLMAWTASRWIIHGRVSFFARTVLFDGTVQYMTERNPVPITRK